MREVLFILFIAAFCLFGCENDRKRAIFEQNHKKSIGLEFPGNKDLEIDFSDRSDIIQNMKDKIENDEPLIVHCFVPLCDNEHQGIVPTSESLGNGFSLTSNLYWATSNGMKKFFLNDKYWYYLNGLPFEPNDTILERAVFERYVNHTKVILICDAYRGDMMKPCLEDYFNCLAGNSLDSIPYHKAYLEINKNADMVVFNGHNGLMDTEIEPITIAGNGRFFKRKDAVSIACSSHGYFSSYFMKTHSYPLVTTTSLLYPGAFILDGIIEKWASFEAEENIKNAAGDAYHKVKNCGQKPARNMFNSGW